MFPQLSPAVSRSDNIDIVNPAGAHEVGKLNELLESFTKKYVQCHQCGNPETRIRIKKENIFLKCKVSTAALHAVAQCSATSCIPGNIKACTSVHEMRMSSPLQFQHWGVRLFPTDAHIHMQACGAVSDVDMRHRLNTYIIKNPPEDKISKAEKRCVLPYHSSSITAQGGSLCL